MSSRLPLRLAAVSGHFPCKEDPVKDRIRSLIYTIAPLAIAALALVAARRW